MDDRFQIVKFILIVIATMIFTGCFDNEIYFDKEKMMIISCDKHPLTRMYVEKRRGILYRITLKENRNANFFNLNGNNPEFEIRMDNHLVKEFKLEPNSFYKISNVSNGDAAGASITLETDNNNIIKVISEGKCH